MEYKNILNHNCLRMRWLTYAKTIVRPDTLKQYLDNNMVR